MNGKKICILIHGLGSDGTSSFVLTLAEGLAAEQYDVTIVLAVKPDGLPSFRENEVRDITGGKITIYKTCDLVGIKKKICHAMRLYRLLKNGNYDVFHANMNLFNGINMFVAWLAGVPVRVSHSHTSQSTYEENTGKHFVVRVYREIMRKLIWKFSNRRCGCSSLAMDYLYNDRWKNDEHSSVIYNGIDLGKFSYTEFNRENMKKELDLPDGKLLIAVGRLAKEKNPFFVVDVMAELHRRHQNVHLIWIGDGILRKSIEEKISAAGAENYIRLLGVKYNVNDYLRCSDLFLMPSIFEGLGIALIEAQAADLPCVVSDTIPDLADVGKCVFVPLKDDASVWADRICDVLDDTIQLKIDQTKIQKFDQQFMIKQMEKVYD